MNATGYAALANLGGVVISAGASENLIGSSDPGARNIISANTGNGVTITGAGTNLNRIAGNYIGVDIAGSIDLGNTSIGVRIDLGASNNFVGTKFGWRVRPGRTEHYLRQQ